MRKRRPAPSASVEVGTVRGAALAVGLVAAQVAFAATFRGPRSQFWQRMTVTGETLGTLALLASPPARATRIGPKEVALGRASAGTP